MNKSSTFYPQHTRESDQVEADMRGMREWIWEMQGEVVVADAASSRYRGRISMEVIRGLLSVSDLERMI